MKCWFIFYIKCCTNNSLQNEGRKQGGDSAFQSKQICLKDVQPVPYLSWISDEQPFVGLDLLTFVVVPEWFTLICQQSIILLLQPLFSRMGIPEFRLFSDNRPGMMPSLIVRFIGLTFDLTQFDMCNGYSSSFCLISREYATGS